VAAALVGVGTQVARGAWYASNQRPARFGVGEAPSVYPIGTLARFRSESLGGPVFNTLDFGGFLIEHLWPRERVFIDGRLEVIGDAFYGQYLRVLSGRGWPDLVRPFQPRVAFVSIAATDLTRRIVQDPEWELVDVDAASILFARRIPEHRAAIERSIAHWTRENAAVPGTAEVLEPPALPPWWRRWLAPRRFPFEHWGRGNALFVLGLDQAARREYARALAGAYPEAVLVRNYAAVCYRLGRRAEARAWLELVVRLEPDNQQARRILAELSTP
jgi:tetratricopeptide (TPR) repeat protein